LLSIGWHDGSGLDFCVSGMPRMPCRRSAAWELIWQFRTQSRHQTYLAQNFGKTISLKVILRRFKDGGVSRLEPRNGSKS